MARPYKDILNERLERGLIILEGSFFPDGVSTPDATLNKGHGFSVVRTSKGVYTLTIGDKYTELVAFDVNFQLHSAADIMAEFGDVDLSAKTVVIRLVKKSDGLVDDPPAYNANNVVRFCLKLKMSSFN